MPRALPVILLAAAVAAVGCRGVEALARPPSAPASPAASTTPPPPDATPSPVSQPPAPCATATPVAAVLPVSFLTPAGRDPVGPAGSWYRSPDGRIWVDSAALPTVAGGTHKVLWLKPVGSRLEVVGRRLDGDAPPLRADLPDGYFGDFQASGIGFPTPGCWEVEARADGSALRVALQVR